MNKNPKKNQETAYTTSESPQRKSLNLKKIAITGAAATAVTSAVAFTLVQENNNSEKNKTMKAIGKNAITHPPTAEQIQCDKDIQAEIDRLFGTNGATGAMQQLFNDYFDSKYKTSVMQKGVVS